MKESKDLELERRNKLINEPQAEIKELIEMLKSKLNIEESLEEIVTEWGHRSSRGPLFRLVEPSEERINYIIRCCKRPFAYYSNRHELPWSNVLASICMYSDKVVFSEESCPFCGEKMVGLYYNSSSWSWKNLCGTAGAMVICPNCAKQFAYEGRIES
jgi:hypothetical protein